MLNIRHDRSISQTWLKVLVRHYLCQKRIKDFVDLETSSTLSLNGHDVFFGPTPNFGKVELVKQECFVNARRLIIVAFNVRQGTIST